MVSPKDPLDSDEQCGVIYKCACDVCGELDVGETGRSVEERVEKHGRSIERQDSYVGSEPTSRTVRRHRRNNKPIIDKINVLDKETRDWHRKVFRSSSYQAEGDYSQRPRVTSCQSCTCPCLGRTSRGGARLWPLHRLGLEALISHRSLPHSRMKTQKYGVEILEVNNTTVVTRRF